MGEQEITLRVPTLDVSAVPLWGYLIAYLVLSWFIIGPFFSRYYYRSWVNYYDPKDSSYKIKIEEVEVATIFLWAFSPVTAAALFIGWLAYYIFAPIYPIFCLMVLGRRQKV